VSRTSLGPVPPGGVPFLGKVFAPGNFISSLDTFVTRNQFYGGQLGVRAAYTHGRLYGQVDVKLALGNTHQVVNIEGVSALTSSSGVPLGAARGGLFAGPSRLGTLSSDSFSIIPEVEFKVGYNITDNISVFVGYNFLYWTDVARPGEQVNRSIDTREIPTSFGFNNSSRVDRLVVPVSHSDFWAQGINFGVELKY
jgi:hypothetical protein